jgi:heparanase 1
LTNGSSPTTSRWSRSQADGFGNRITANLASANKAQAPARQAGPTTAGIDPGLFEYRLPLDLSNARLRKLAAALGPGYVRVRKQWNSVIDFAHAVDGKIITSFAFGGGTRDAAGVWNPEQARRFVACKRAVGGSIAAAEFMNEPNYAVQGGAPKGYDPAAFGRDIDAFRRFFRDAPPGSLFLGPGSTGEGGVLGNTPTPAN